MQRVPIEDFNTLLSGVPLPSKGDKKIGANGGTDVAPPLMDSFTIPTGDFGTTTETLPGLKREMSLVEIGEVAFNMGKDALEGMMERMRTEKIAKEMLLNNIVRSPYVDYDEFVRAYDATFAKKEAIEAALQDQSLPRPTKEQIDGLELDLHDLSAFYAYGTGGSEGLIQHLKLRRKKAMTQVINAMVTEQMDTAFADDTEGLAKSLAEAFDKDMASGDVFGTEAGSNEMLRSVRKVNEYYETLMKYQNAVRKQKAEEKIEADPRIDLIKELFGDDAEFSIPDEDDESREALLWADDVMVGANDEKRRRTPAEPQQQGARRRGTPATDPADIQRSNRIATRVVPASSGPRRVSGFGTAAPGPQRAAGFGTPAPGPQRAAGFGTAAPGPQRAAGFGRSATEPAPDSSKGWGFMSKWQGFKMAVKDFRATEALANGWKTLFRAAKETNERTQAQTAIRTRGMERQQQVQKILMKEFGKLNMFGSLINLGLMVPVQMVNMSVGPPAAKAKRLVTMLMQNMDNQLSDVTANFANPELEPLFEAARAAGEQAKTDPEAAEKAFKETVAKVFEAKPDLSKDVGAFVDKYYEQQDQIPRELGGMYRMNRAERLHELFERGEATENMWQEFEFFGERANPELAGMMKRIENVRGVFQQTREAVQRNVKALADMAETVPPIDAADQLYGSDLGKLISEYRVLGMNVLLAIPMGIWNTGLSLNPLSYASNISAAMLKAGWKFIEPVGYMAAGGAVAGATLLKGKVRELASMPWYLIAIVVGLMLAGFVFIGLNPFAYIWGTVVGASTSAFLQQVGLGQMRTFLRQEGWIYGRVKKYQLFAPIIRALTAMNGNPTAKFVVHNGLTLFSWYYTATRLWEATTMTFAAIDKTPYITMGELVGNALTAFIGLWGAIMLFSCSYLAIRARKNDVTAKEFGLFLYNNPMAVYSVVFIPMKISHSLVTMYYTIEGAKIVDEKIDELSAEVGAMPYAQDNYDVMRQNLKTGETVLEKAKTLFEAVPNARDVLEKGMAAMRAGIETKFE